MLSCGGFKDYLLILGHQKNDDCVSLGWRDARQEVWVVKPRGIDLVASDSLLLQTSGSQRLNRVDTYRGDFIISNSYC